MGEAAVVLKREKDSASEAHRLRIAMLGHKHVHGREGGVEIVVTELAARMAALGHEVTCYDRSGPRAFKAEPRANGERGSFHVKRVWTLNLRGIAAVTSSFSAALRATLSDADVVHIHAEGSAAMSWLPRLRGKRVIVTVHGLDWARAKWGRFASGYLRWCEGQAVKHADAIIVLSRETRDYFKARYNRDCAFIPNGVERPERVAVNAVNGLWGLEARGYVLFVGRVVPEKGIHYLIEAWKGVRTDKKLVITDGCSDTEAYMRRLKAMAGESVVFTGFQQGRILAELYSNAYVFTLPSDLEGMPLSLLEAMSYGNCCLVSDIPECADVVEDRGVTFPKADVARLRAALQNLIDHPEIVERYRQGVADFVCGRHDWDDVVAQTLALYRGQPARR